MANIVKSSVLLPLAISIPALSVACPHREFWLACEVLFKACFRRGLEVNNLKLITRQPDLGGCNIAFGKVSSKLPFAGVIFKRKILETLTLLG